MRTWSKWTRPIFPAVIIVLFVWTTALADHANVTFKQTNNSNGGTAIVGVANGIQYSTHYPTGIWGRGTASGSVGVQGTSPYIGVNGTASGNAGTGVRGNGPYAGVAGYSSQWGVFGSGGPSGRGVYGVGATGVYGSGNTVGVMGQSFGGNDTVAVYGLFGRGGFYSGGIGVKGESNAKSGIGVSGIAYNGTGVRGQTVIGTAVLGIATDPAAETMGVSGVASSTKGIGVMGEATAATGNTRGLVGQAASTSGIGVLGIATAATGNTVGLRGRALSTDGTGVHGNAAAATGTNVGVQGESASTSGTGVFGLSTASTGSTKGVWGKAVSPTGVAIQGDGQNGAKAGLFNGRVDINCPAADCLFVNGGAVADLAEDMPVAGRVRPGDAVVLAADRDGVVRASRPYDTMVAGVVSGTARIRFGIRHRGPVAPVGMVGVVRANVSTVSGAIRRGDLLTTSGVPGHLMRCSSPARCVGAIVGKAMQPLAKGNGQILVLLWRQ